MLFLFCVNFNFQRKFAAWVLDDFHDVAGVLFDY